MNEPLAERMDPQLVHYSDYLAYSALPDAQFEEYTPEGLHSLAHLSDPEYAAYKLGLLEEEQLARALEHYAYAHLNSQQPSDFYPDAHNNELVEEARPFSYVKDEDVLDMGWSQPDSMGLGLGFCSPVPASQPGRSDDVFLEEAKPVVSGGALEADLSDSAAQDESPEQSESEARGGGRRGGNKREKKAPRKGRQSSAPVSSRAAAPSRQSSRRHSSVEAAEVPAVKARRGGKGREAGGKSKAAAPGVDGGVRKAQAEKPGRPAKLSGFQTCRSCLVDGKQKKDGPFRLPNKTWPREMLSLLDLHCSSEADRYCNTCFGTCNNHANRVKKQTRSLTSAADNAELLAKLEQTRRERRANGGKAASRRGQR